MKKKIGLILCLLVMGITTGFAQNYILEYHVHFSTDEGSGSRRYYLDWVNYTQWNSSTPQTIPGFSFSQLRGVSEPNDRVYIPASGGPIKLIDINTGRQVRTLGVWNGDCSGGQDYKVLYSNTSTPTAYFNIVPTDWGCLDFHSTITVSKFQFYADCTVAVDLANNPSLYLPGENDVAVLKATPGFDATVYRWMYRTPSDTDWQYLSNQASLKSNGGATLSVSAKDIFGTTWEQHLGESVSFCLDLSLGSKEKITNTVTLNVVTSAPHIASIDTIPNACFGESNGKLKISFDRQLYSDEYLSVTVTGPAGSTNHAIVGSTLAEPGFYVESTGLPAGTYNVTLLGKRPYPGSLTTYVDDPRHRGTKTFAGPAAVTFTSSRRNVYCHGGADGTITVNATGGTPPYDLHYNQDGGAYQSVAFSSTNQHVLGNLVPGTYNFFVKDANGCIMKDNMDQPHTQTYTITQPEPLEIDYRASFNPLAYGYTDGWVKVVLKGGTPFHDKSYTLRWTDSLGNVLTTVQNQFIGSGYQSELTNIGDGRYYLQVLDSAYLMAQADRRTGCLLVDSFKLVQPPMLIAEVSEHRYVSCNSYSDGELYAWAHGGIEIPTQRYHYQWFKDNSGSWQSIGQTDSIARNLPAGVYRVSVTDANVITRYSLPFTLVQPDVLEITTTATNVACNGDSSGRITAAIQGGTSPYRYEWNTGDTTLAVQNLVAGNYLLTTEDTRGCLAKKRTEVSERNPVTFNNVMLKSPTCIGMNDGVISFVLSGGQPTYTTAWLHGAVTPTLNSLVAGTYSITVTDSEGCIWNKTFELEEALPVPLDLGKDRTLCAGQAWVADATVPTGAGYRWSGTNGFGASSPKVTLTVPGTYYATAITAAGCVGKDTITINTSPAAISAIFTSPTQGYVDESVVFVNISNPRPESVEWQVPSGAEVLEKTSDRLELKFKRAGVYEVGILSRVGECEKLSTQSVAIVENTQLPVASAEKLPFVIDFYVAPNPSSGSFTAYVKLREESNIRLRIVNIGTGMIVDDRRQNGMSSYTVSYSLSLASGTYALMLETGGEKRVFKMIIY